MTASRQDLTLLLYQALAEPIGLLLAAEPPETIRQRLYQARAAASDPALAILQIRRSPFADGTLVICKGATKAAQLGAPHVEA